MNVERLRQIVAEDESQTTEFKLESEKQADLAEVIVSFANAEGGNLFVGVTDDGEIIGVKNIKSIVDRLHSAARRIDPPLNDVVSVLQVESDGNIVVVAQVPDGLEATYSLSGRFRIREGSFNRLMSSADVIEHATRRGTLYYENVPVRNAGLDALAEDRVKAFLATRLQAGMPDRPLDQLLVDMGAAAQDEEKVIRPSVGGTLFFGSWPQFHLSYATILAARLVGPRGTKIIDRATIEGTIPEIIDRAIQFVHRNTKHGLFLGRSDTAQAQEMDEYPQEAVREAITNACCHRDYMERSPIQLKIYDDRLVVSNPGGLLPGLDIHDLEGKHRTRNPMLADWLHTAGYVERFGIGVIRMQEAMAQAGLPAPRFVSTPASFEVTLTAASTDPADYSALQSDNRSRDTSRGETDQTSEFRLHSSPWYTQTWSAARGPI